MKWKYLPAEVASSITLPISSAYTCISRARHGMAWPDVRSPSVGGAGRASKLGTHATLVMYWLKRALEEETSAA